MLNVRGPDLKELQKYSAQILATDESRLPAWSIRTRHSPSGIPEVHVQIDRAKAADLGVRATDVANALRRWSPAKKSPNSKMATTNIRSDCASCPTIATGRRRSRTCGFLRRRLGQVQLSNFARLDKNIGPTTIERQGRARQVTLVANLENGVGIGDAVAALQAQLGECRDEAGLHDRIYGPRQDVQDLQKSFIMAFLFSAIFMYMVLAAQFESFLHPITIMLSLPLSIPFALFSLWISHSRLDLFSGLGILLLFGIVKKNSILQIDYTNTLRARGMERHEAIIKANHARLRPILMTTLAIVAGMIPIVLSRGPGAGSRAPIGIVVTGGQMLCLLLTLLFTPVAYSLFDDLVVRFRRPASVYNDAAEPMKAD